MNDCMLYKLQCTQKTVFNYSLFAGQKVFPDAEEIFSILSQAFDEAFLSGKVRVGGGKTI